MDLYKKYRSLPLWITVLAVHFAFVQACRHYEFTKTKISAFSQQRKQCEGYKTFRNDDGLYLFFSSELRTWVIGPKACSSYNVMAHGLQSKTRSVSVNKIRKWMALGINSEWVTFNDKLRCADNGLQNIAPVIECGGKDVEITLSPALLSHSTNVRVGKDSSYSVCRPQRRRDKTKAGVISFPLDKCQPKMTLGDDSIVLTYHLYKTHRTINKKGKMIKTTDTTEVSCQYKRTVHTKANMFRAEQIVYRSFAADKGHFDFEISLHKHSNLLKQKYQEGQNIMIGQRIYTRVKLLSDVNLNIFVKNCVATPKQSIALKYPKLKHYLINPLGCFADHTFHYEWQSNKQYVFSFKMFQFLDPANPGKRLQNMNLQCDVVVCPYGSTNRHCKLPRDCSKGLNKKRSKREVSRLHNAASPKVYSVSFGFNVKDPVGDKKRPDRYISLKNLSPSTTAGAAIIGIATVSSLVGAILAVVLQSVMSKGTKDTRKGHHIDT